MTSTLSPNDTGDIRLGEGTRDLTYLTQRPALRRADASGEFPFYRPQTIGDVDEMARLALGATLVLPVNAEPAPPRHAVPTVYMPALPEAETQPVIDLAAVMPQPDGRPDGYRPLHRAKSRWARDAVMFGAGAASAMALLLALARILAAIR